MAETETKSSVQARELNPEVSEDIKEEVRRDVFTTEEEAAARAEEIGCVGTHSHDDNGNTVYMPCASHQDYRDLTGRDVRSEDKQEAFSAELKYLKPDDDEDEDKDYGTFEGYGSVFGNKDLGNDVIEKGAFKESLKRKKPHMIKLLYQHKSDMPIGVFDEVKEDEHGLYVKGRLALKTVAGAEAYELLKMGALDGMSIGFRVNPEKVSYDKRSRRRYIKEVDLMEVSLVTFPMNPKATVRSVKGEEISIREWENGLRDVFHLSRSEAKVAAAAVTKSFSDQRDAENNAELVDAIKELTKTITLTKQEYFMSQEIKDAIQDLGNTFAEFKKVNDERLEAVEKGDSTAEYDSKLSKIEEKLDSIEDVNQKLVAAEQNSLDIKEQVEKLETVLKRPHSGVETKQVDEYMSAFETYCRKGLEGLDPVEKKALTVSNDSTGGYLAPPEYVRELLKTVTEISPIRSIARVRSTGQRSIQIPKRTGQFSAQWVSESGTRSETTGYQVGLEELPAHEHYALVDISEQDLEDTVFDLEAEMQSEFSEQFAKAEGAAFVSGDAVGKPEGFMTNSDVGSVISGSDSAILADSLISLVHNIKSDYGRNGVFVFNRSTLAAIRKLKDTAGQYVFQAGMDLRGGAMATILGYPYVEATDMPSIAQNAFPVAFGDFRRAYMIVDRVNLAVLRDPFTQATTGNVRYIARRRVGGQVVQAEAINKLKISAS